MEGTRNERNVGGSRGDVNVEMKNRAVQELEGWKS